MRIDFRRKRDLERKKRIFWLDAARGIAILLVVFTHAHCLAGLANPGADSRIHDILVTSFFYSVDRIGVPLFLMISGALMLTSINKSAQGCYSGKARKRYKRIGQFLFLTCIYSIITNFMGYFFVEKMGCSAAILKAVQVNNVFWESNNGYASHLWYMYAIILLYIAVPFIGAMVRNIENKAIFEYIIISVILFIIPGMMGIYGEHSHRTVLNGLFKDFFSVWISYYLLGFLIFNHELSVKWVQKRKSLFIILITILFIMMCIPLLWSYIDRRFYLALYDYDHSIFVFISSTVVLLIIKYFHDKLLMVERILRILAENSFGIYLIHFAFVIISSQYLKTAISVSKESLTFLIFTFSILMSLSITVLLRKSKVTRWLVS